MSNNIEKKPFHEEFASKVIAHLEARTAPWQKPWSVNEQYAERDYNPISGTPYTGVNRLQLAMSDFTDPRWMTFSQASDAGYQIKKGSKATDIAFYQFHKEVDTLDDTGKTIKQKIQLDRPILRLTKVFNAEQMVGVPPLEIKEQKQVLEIHQRAEQILQNSSAVIKHDQSNKAFYNQRADIIHLQLKEAFENASQYYAIALHEIGHWTGHESRLNRELPIRGTQSYAKEELRTEIASWMLGDDIGVGHKSEQNTSYITSWVKILKDEPLEIMRACRDAEKIKDFVMGFEHAKEHTQEQSLEKILGGDYKYLKMSSDEIFPNTVNESSYDDDLRIRDFYHAKEMLFHEMNNKENNNEKKAEIASNTVELIKHLKKYDEPMEYKFTNSGDIDNPYTIEDTRDFTMSEKLSQFYSEVKAYGKKEITEELDEEQQEAEAEKKFLEELEAEEKKADEDISNHGSTAWVKHVNESIEKGDFLAPHLPDGIGEDGTANYIDIDAKRKEMLAELEKGKKEKASFLGKISNLFKRENSEKAQQNITPNMKEEITQEKVFLSVPYEAKEDAKKHGAKWDKDNKSWFADIGTNLEPLKQWLPENKEKVVIQERLSSEEEFAIQLRDLGFDMQGLPVMDGTIQRVPLIGRNEKDGAYCGYLDDIPAGWAQNYSSGEKIKFIATGHVLSAEERERQQTERVQKLQARENQRLKIQNEVSQEAFLDYFNGQDITSHPYLEKKGVSPIGIKINEENQLLIPIGNVDGQIRGIQYINENESKYYLKGMEKKGNFCMLNPHTNDPLRVNEIPSKILICEGYATGASLYEATGFHVVIAFDSSNLEDVAKNLKTKNPNTDLIICADNDYAHTMVVKGKKVLYNIGLEKAKNVAEIVNATLKVPAFTLTEKEQGLTDFNDLHKSQGIDAVRKQLGIENQINKNKGLER